MSHAIHLGGQSPQLIYLVISVRKSGPFEIEKKKKERKGPQTRIICKTK